MPKWWKYNVFSGLVWSGLAWPGLAPWISCMDIIHEYHPCISSMHLIHAYHPCISSMNIIYRYYPWISSMDIIHGSYESSCMNIMDPPPLHPTTLILWYLWDFRSRSGGTVYAPPCFPECKANSSEYLYINIKVGEEGGEDAHRSHIWLWITTASGA